MLDVLLAKNIATGCHRNKDFFSFSNTHTRYSY
jgi:hypothetical protein